MSSQPARATTAGRVYNDLRNLARRQARPTDEVLLLYALERFLFRLAQSSFRNQLIVKGGALLAAYDLRRQTQDIDIQARGIDNDDSAAVAVVRQICEVDAVDGLDFGVEGITTRPIRQGDVYAGVRVRLPVALATARLAFRVDLNFGDPIVPAPITVSFPSLLEGPFELVGYPLATMLAEKLVTMVQLGDANARDRDFGDVVRVARRHVIDGHDLWAACCATAAYRGVALRSLSHLTRELVDRRQGPWSRWLRRTGLTSALPADFAVALDEVRNFADPVLGGTMSAGRWHPAMRTWVQM